MTEFAVIASMQDKAGMNIASHLQQRSFRRTNEQFDGHAVWAKGNIRLYFINEIQIYADIADSIPADVLVFASKHKSESARPTLTVHAIGNWGNAEMGGRDRKIVPTSANLIKNYLFALEKQRVQKNLAYGVSLECTHHGPYLTKPTVFIELGSSEAQWADSNAAEAVAEAIAGSTGISGNYKTAIALGGGHYCPEFTKLLLRTDYAISHICPKYALQHFDNEMLEKALSASLENVKEAVVDRKGLGEHKGRILDILVSKKILAKDARKLIPED